MDRPLKGCNCSDCEDTRKKLEAFLIWLIWEGMDYHNPRPSMPDHELRNILSDYERPE